MSLPGLKPLSLRECVLVDASQLSYALSQQFPDMPPDRRAREVIRHAEHYFAPAGAPAGLDPRVMFAATHALYPTTYGSADEGVRDQFADFVRDYFAACDLAAPVVVEAEGGDDGGM